MRDSVNYTDALSDCREPWFILTSLTSHDSMLSMKCKLYYVPMAYFRAFRLIHQEYKYLALELHLRGQELIYKYCYPIPGGNLRCRCRLLKSLLSLSIVLPTFFDYNFSSVDKIYDCFCVCVR